jgi:hypothetical protein
MSLTLKSLLKVYFYLLRYLKAKDHFEEMGRSQNDLSLNSSFGISILKQLFKN